LGLVHTIFIAFVLFGLSATILGYLAFRSTFLPRALGAVVAIAGITWVAMSEDESTV
jgi:hypothetical protein